MNVIYVVTVVYLAGIIAAGETGVSPLYFGAVAVLVSGCAALFRRNEKVFTALLCVVAFATSIFMFGVDRIVDQGSSFSEYLRITNDSKRLERLTGTVVKSAMRGDDQSEFTLAVERVTVGWKKEIPVHGKVFIRARGEQLFAPKYGDRVVVEGRVQRINEMKASSRIYMSREGVNARMFLAKEGARRVLGRGDVPFVMELGYRARSKFIKVLADRVGGEESAVLGRLLLGKDQPMAPETEDLFRRAGLTHILVVSGLHVGFLLGILVLLSFVWARRPAISFFAIGSALIFYYGVTGGGPSIARAAIMGFVMLIAILRGSHYSARHSIFIAALLMMIADPQCVNSVSAQLSFLAAAGVIFIYPQLALFVAGNSPGEKMLKAALVSIAASLPLYPVIAYYFNVFCVVSPLSNIIVVPLSLVALPLDLLACALGVLPGGLSILAVAPAFAAGLVAKLMIISAAFFAALPLSNIPVAGPSFLWIAVYECAVVAFTYTVYQSFHGSDERVADGLFFLVALGLLLMVPFVWNPPFTGLEATFIDVGEGDSTYIEVPEGEGAREFKMLIDGGGGWGASPGNVGAAKSVSARYLMNRRTQRLDLLVLTHPEADHMNGLLWVAENVKVDRFMDIGIPRDIVCGVYYESDYCVDGGDRANYQMMPTQRIKYMKFLYALKRQGTEYISLRAGGVFALPSGARIKILSPDQRLMEGNSSKSSSNSISSLLKVEYGKASVLVTGDISNATEERVVEFEKSLLPSSVMKVPHHGSRHSSSSLFLKSVSPQAAVVSTGGPLYYGHPSADAVERYRLEGIKLFRTDRDGNVTCRIRPDGNARCRAELAGLE